MTTKKYLTELESYFEYGTDIKARRVFLAADVDEDYHYIIKGLHYLSDTKDPIEVYITTFGGDIYDAFGIYDTIVSLENHVTTIAVGKVMSAGTLILSAGDERISYPNTYFMCHECSYDMPEVKHKEMKSAVTHADDIMDRLVEVMASRTNLEIRRWKSMLKNPDVYFDAEKALEIGLITKIKE